MHNVSEVSSQKFFTMLRSSHLHWNRLKIVPVLIILCMYQLSCRSATHEMDTTNMAFVRERAEYYNFDRPSKWQINKMPDTAGRGYELYPLNEREKANVVITQRQISSEDMNQMYARWLIIASENLSLEDSMRGISIEGTPTPEKIDDREGLRIRWSGGRGWGKKITNLVKMPGGDVLEVTMSIPGEQEQKEYEAIYRRIVESISFN